MGQYEGQVRLYMSLYLKAFTMNIYKSLNETAQAWVIFAGIVVAALGLVWFNALINRSGSGRAIQLRRSGM